MVCDLGQRHFEKIEAAVQISYGVSLAHRSKNRTRPCRAAACGVLVREISRNRKKARPARSRVSLWGDIPKKETAMMKQLSPVLAAGRERLSEYWSCKVWLRPLTTKPAIGGGDEGLAHLLWSLRTLKLSTTGGTASNK